MLINMNYFLFRPSEVRNSTIRSLSLIERLVRGTLSGDVFLSVLKACPGVDDLCIEGFKVTERMSSSIRSNMKNLENVKLFRIAFASPTDGMDYLSKVEKFKAECFAEKVSNAIVEVNSPLNLVTHENEAIVVQKRKRHNSFLQRFCKIS